MTKKQCVNILPNAYIHAFYFGGIMNKNGLLAFLSSDSIQKHEEYLKALNLKYSLMKKSYPAIAECGIAELARTRIEPGAREAAIEILRDIYSHECFFDSFCESPAPCKQIKRYYSSDAAFVYEIFIAARHSKSSFIYVYKNKRGVPIISEKFSDNPLLAIDLCEHAYIFDYGFSRDEYLRHALGYLNLSKLLLEPLDNKEKKG